MSTFQPSRDRQNNNSRIITSRASVMVSDRGAKNLKIINLKNIRQQQIVRKIVPCSRQMRQILLSILTNKRNNFYINFYFIDLNLHLARDFNLMLNEL